MKKKEREACVPQAEKPLCAETRVPARCNKEPRCFNKDPEQPKQT